MRTFLVVAALSALACSGTPTDAPPELERVHLVATGAHRVTYADAFGYEVRVHAAGPAGATATLQTSLVLPDGDVLVAPLRSLVFDAEDAGPAGVTLWMRSPARADTVRVQLDGDDGNTHTVDIGCD